MTVLVNVTVEGVSDRELGFAYRARCDALHLEAKGSTTAAALERLFVGIGKALPAALDVRVAIVAA